MPVTADEVDVVLGVQMQKYLSDLNRADARFAQLTSNMEKEARAVGAAFSSLKGPEFDFAPKVEGAANSMNRLGGSTANVAAQFQDIAVQLQAGQSPFTIALQQGTQLSAVFEQLRANGQKVGPALISAFTSIISPISLATIAVIALGGAAVQWLGTMIPETEDANDVLKRHKEEIDGILDGYESAKESVDDYLDSVKLLPREAVQLELADQYKEAQKEIEEFRARVEKFANVLRAGIGEGRQETAKLLQDFVDGKTGADELTLALTKLKVDDTLNKNLQAIAGSLLEGVKAAGALEQALIAITFAAAEASRDSGLQNALDAKVYIDEQIELNSLTAEQLALNKEIATIRDESERGKFVLSEQQITDLAKQRLEAEKRRADIKKAEIASGRDDKKEETKYERERKAVETLMEKLREEAALVGVVGKEKEITIALRKAGAAATDEERAEIEKLVAFTYEEAKAVKENQKALQDFLSVGESGLDSFINSILDGKSATEAWGAALNDIGRQLINLGVSSLFSQTGPIASLFNGGGLAGARAAGGPVSGGKSYLVGEKGPEIFTPSSGGNITPNGASAAGMSFAFAPSVDARGADTAAVARLERTLAQMMAEFPARVRHEINGKGRRW